MKFCRSCGSALAAAGPPAGGASGGALGAVMQPTMPAGGAPMLAPIGGAPMMAPPPLSAPPLASPPMMSPAGILPPAGAPGSPAQVAVGAQGSMVTCPRCGTATPVGFAYCQQCGLHMQALQPTDPGANPRPREPSRPPGVIGGSIGGSGAPAGGTAPGAHPLSSPILRADQPIDPQAATLASDGIRAGSISPPAARPTPAAGPSWGTAVLVNRDGSDGQRFALAGEYSVVGRAGADIAFDDDRFLSRQHARLERGTDGAVTINPLDALNGVFRKTDAPVELVDGMTILVGREVLRYEKVAAEETKVTPLVRHGVALFGSPPREPWGRLMQIVPSGGYRDVRHLAGEEIVLGREEGDIVFRDDAFMSRRHAAITWDGRRAQITDLGSSNGTFVRISGAAPIKHGDHVRMGDQLLRIELGK